MPIQWDDEISEVSLGKSAPSGIRWDDDVQWDDGIEEHGIIGELGAGLGRGVLRVVGTPANLADIAGEAVGWEGLEKTGEAVAGAIEEKIETTPWLKKSQSISGDIRDNPQLWTDPRWYLSLVGEGAPTIASMIIPGMAAAKVAKGAGMGLKAIQAARFGGALTAGMGLEAGGAAEDVRQYEERTSEQIPIGKKLKTVIGTGVVAGSLEAIPVFNLFGGTVARKLIGRIITSMAFEGGTEGAQEIVANAFAKAGYDADRDMVGGVIESVIGGVLLGGGMGAMQQTFQERIKETNPDEVADVLEQAEKEEAADEQIPTEATTVLDQEAMLNNIKTDLESGEITADDVSNFARLPEAEGIVDDLNALIIDAKAKEELAPARKIEPEALTPEVRQEIIEPEMPAPIEPTAEVAREPVGVEKETPASDRSPKINAIRIAKTENTKSYADIKNIEPGKIVTVYRAIPADTKGEIEAGDFVAQDREVANFYANDLISRGITDETIMLSKKIKASEIRLHPDHQAQGVENEFIYNPEFAEKTGKPTMPKPPKAKPSEAVTEEIKGEVIPEVKPKGKMYVDEFGKTIVKEKSGLKYAVNNIQNPTFLTVWDSGKKIGEMSTADKAVHGAEGYVQIGNIEVSPKYRKQGIATELYKTLLEHLPKEAKGIMAYSPEIIAKKAIPKIYKKLGGRLDKETGHYFIDKKPVKPKVEKETIPVDEAISLQKERINKANAIDKVFERMSLKSLLEFKELGKTEVPVEFFTEKEKERKVWKPGDKIPGIEKKVEVETTPEGKEISVDLTKKEEVAITPKQQKEFLLAEIDKAVETEAKKVIKENPNIKLEEALDFLNRRTISGSDTMYTFEVPNDGTFEIVGSNILEFKRRVKSTFPATIISKQFKPTKPAKRAIPTTKYNKIIVVPPKELKPADIDRIFKEVADTEARDITGAIKLNPFQNWLLSQDITKAVKDKIRSVAGKDYIDEARIKIEKQDLGYARDMVEYRQETMAELQDYYDSYKAKTLTLKQIEKETGVKRSGHDLRNELQNAKYAYAEAVRYLEKLEKSTGVEPLSKTKFRLIENIKSEKGDSALINDLSQLGVDAIRRGHTSFKAFSAQMKTTLSEVWDKIKHLMREAYEAAKMALKSERGEVILRKGKPPEKITKPTKDYRAMLKKYQEAHKIIDESLKDIPPQKPPKLPSEYEQGKDSWFGNKDWAEVRNAIEKGKLQDTIRDTVSIRKNMFGKKIFDQKSRDVDAAIHLYLDLKRNPAHRAEFYKELPAEWKKIVDKIELIEATPKLKAIADHIRNEGDITGKLALEADVIHNQIENHVNRVWKKRAGISEKIYTDALQKFKTKSRHAKHRVFDTILEGLALKDKNRKHIFDLQIRGATSNLQTLKDEISRVIEDKKLITEMRKMKTEDGDPLLSTHRVNDTYVRIEHPNFKVWEFATGIDLMEKEVDSSTGLSVGDSIRAKDRGNIGKIIAITDKGVDVHFVNKKEGTEKTVSFKKDAVGKLERPLIKVNPKGRNFFITDEGTVLEKRELYAPEKIARDLNKVLGVSRLKGVRILGVPAIDILTKYNAIFKSWILVTSFFHHQAFLRSYYLPSQHKTRAEWNPFKAYKMGKKAIEDMVPEIELLVRNGLTMFKMQDWEESVLRREDTVFGKILDKTTTSKAIKDKINELRERQANFLFGNFGAALKTQAALIELRNMTHKHPDMDVQERAKMVARLINDDFGGLHLGRMGRDPTIQHIMRLGLLAPDWTESNVRTMVKALKSPGGPEETAMYRRFWASTITKGLSMIFVANILMAAFDDDDFFERYKKAWKAGHFRWLDIDVTPIYKMFGGKSEARKYFSLFGHFRDPLKFIRHPIRSLHHKGSVVYGIFHEAMAGTDWKGQRFTTLSELIGVDDKGVYLTTTKTHKKGDPKGGKLAGKLVVYGAKGPISLEQMPSYIVSQLIGVQPIQVQNLIAMLTGEVAAFDGIARSLGMHTGTTYPTTKSIRDDFIEEYMNLKKGRKSLAGLLKRVRKYNLKHKGNEIIKWSNIIKNANKRLRIERIKK